MVHHTCFECMSPINPFLVLGIFLRELATSIPANFCENLRFSTVSYSLWSPTGLFCVWFLFSACTKSVVRRLKRWNDNFFLWVFVWEFLQTSYKKLFFTIFPFWYLVHFIAVISGLFISAVIGLEATVETRMMGFLGVWVARLAILMWEISVTCIFS